MRVTVKELIEELQKLEPEANVEFRQGGSERVGNHVARIDNFGAKVTIVVEKGA